MASAPGDLFHLIYQPFPFLSSDLLPLPLLRIIAAAADGQDATHRAHRTGLLFLSDERMLARIPKLRAASARVSMLRHQTHGFLFELLCFLSFISFSPSFYSLLTRLSISVEPVQQLSHHFWDRSKEETWESIDPCAVCHLQAEQRLRYTEIFIRSLNEASFRATYEGTPGLCVRHFLFAYNLAQQQFIRDELVSVQESAFSDLKQELEEFCRKNDYRFSEEGFRRESDAWLRAALMMEGDSGM